MKNPLNKFLPPRKVATLTLGDGISAVVGAIIIGAIILPDITRFVKHWSSAIYIAFISYVVVQLVVMGSAGLAGATSGKADILDIMIDLGLGIGASIIVIAGSLGAQLTQSLQRRTWHHRDLPKIK